MDSGVASCSTTGWFFFHVLILRMTGLASTPVVAHEDTKDEPEHIAKLTDGRIGQDAFDVKLDHCNCCGENGGYAANDTYDSQCYGGYLKECMGTSDQVNTGSDHRGRVNERTDRCRAFHGIR